MKDPNVLLSQKKHSRIRMAPSLSRQFANSINCENNTFITSPRHVDSQINKDTSRLNSFGGSDEHATFSNFIIKMFR